MLLLRRLLVLLGLASLLACARLDTRLEPQLVRDRFGTGDRMAVTGEPWIPERATFVRGALHRWQLQPAEATLTASMLKHPSRLEVAVVPPAGSLVRLEISPAVALSAIQLEWSRGSALSLGLLQDLPSLTREDRLLLRLVRDRLGEVPGSPDLAPAITSAKTPAGLATGALAVKLYPAEADGPRLVLPTPTGLLVQTPPGGGALIVRLRPGVAPPQHELRVSAYVAGPTDLGAGWLGFEDKVELWAQAWPAQVAPPEPPPPRPEGWLELTLLSRLWAESDVSRPAARSALLAMALRALLEARPLDGPLFEGHELAIRSELKALHAQPVLPDEDGRWVLLDANNTYFMRFPPEGVLSLQVRGVLEPDEVASTARLEASLQLGEAPPLSLKARARMDRDASGAPLRDRAGHILSSVRRYRVVPAARVREATLEVGLRPLLVRVVHYTHRTLTLDPTQGQTGPLLDEILASSGGSMDASVWGVTLALLGQRDEARQAFGGVQGVSPALAKYAQVQSWLLEDHPVEVRERVQGVLAEESSFDGPPELLPWLKGVELDLAMAVNDGEALLEALRHPPVPPLPSLAEAARLLGEAWHPEWQKDRVVPLLAVALHERPTDAELRSRLSQQLLLEGTWRALPPADMPLPGDPDPAAVTILEPVQTPPGNPELCPAPPPGPGAPLRLRSLPKGVRQRLVVGTPSPLLMERPPEVRFLVGGSGAPGTVYLNLDDQRWVIHPVRRLEPFSLAVPPGVHELWWESGWEGALFVEEAPGHRQGGGASKGQETRGWVSCADLREVHTFFTLEAGKTRRFLVPEADWPGVVRLEVRRVEKPGGMDAAPEPLEVQIGGVRYPLAWTGTSEPREVLADTRLDHRPAGSATILLPLPAGARDVKVLQPTDGKGTLLVRLHFRGMPPVGKPPDTTPRDQRVAPGPREAGTSGPASSKGTPGAMPLAVADSALNTNGSESGAPPLDSLAPTLESLSELSRRLDAAAPAQRPALRLARARMLLQLDLRDLSQPELLAVLADELADKPERRAAGELLEALQDTRGVPVQRAPDNWRRTGLSQAYAIHALAALPQERDPAELELRSVYTALRQEAWPEAAQLLRGLEGRFPEAWKVHWLAARVADARKDHLEAARHYHTLASMATQPGPFYVAEARAVARALEGGATPDRLALEGWTAASRAQALGDPGASSVALRLSRFSRWRGLQNVEANLGLEILQQTGRALERVRPMRDRVEQALLGLPWVAGEGVLIDAGAQAVSKLRFDLPVSVRLEVFCARLAGRESATGESPGRCQLPVLVDGSEVKVLLALPGRAEALELGPMTGSHTLEVYLEDPSYLLRAAVRLQGIRKGLARGEGKPTESGAGGPCGDGARPAIQGQTDCGAVPVKRLPGETRPVSVETSLDGGVAKVTGKMSRGKRTKAAAKIGPGPGPAFVPLPVMSRRRAFAANATQPVRIVVRGPGWVRAEARKIVGGMPVYGPSAEEASRPSVPEARPNQRPSEGLTPLPGSSETSSRKHKGKKGNTEPTSRDASVDSSRAAAAGDAGEGNPGKKEKRHKRRKGSHQAEAVLAHPEAARGRPMLTLEAVLLPLEGNRDPQQSPLFKGPVQPDPEASLDGRERRRVTTPVVGEVAIPEGLWELVLLPSSPSVLTLSVREGNPPGGPVLSLAKVEVPPPAVLEEVLGTAWLPSEPPSVGALPHYGRLGTLALRGRLASPLWDEEYTLPSSLPSAGLEVEYLRHFEQPSLIVPRWLTAQTVLDRVGTSGPLLEEQLGAVYLMAEDRLRLTLDATGAAQAGPTASAWRGRARGLLSLLYRLPADVLLLPGVGASLVGASVSGDESVIDSTFLSSYNSLHPRALFAQLEAYHEPYLDLHLSARTRLVTNPSFVDFDRLDTTLRAVWLRRWLELGAEARLSWRFVDVHRTSSVLVPSFLGLARWNHPLNHSLRLELEGYGRFYPTGGRLELGVTAGIALHFGRAWRDYPPARADFPDMLNQPPEVWRDGRLGRLFGGP